LRDRLQRRHFAEDEINRVVERLTADGTLDDRRVALAAARSGANIKRRGRRRVLQQVQQLGISAETARAAVDEVFGDLDESALLQGALDRRLKGANPRELDRNAIARIVRSLVGQGFDAHAVYARLRKGGAEVDE
jgi:SOS response regulatory protein OraA/RecX